jgi:acyl-CoA synthetase (AMP-forming)/AMP-acid ligase II
MLIRLWKGYHSAALYSTIEETWRGSDRLLIVCPPTLTNFDFVSCLPAGSIEFCGEGWEGEIPIVQPRAVIDYPDEPVLGVFTSGTISGEPRLVLYSRKNIRTSLSGILSFFDHSRIDRVFCYPQPFHTFGLLLGYVLSIENDWRLVTGVGRYTRAFHELRIAISEINTLTLGAPTHFTDLMKYLVDNDRKLSPSYSCIIGGASVSIEIWKRLRDELKIECPTTGYGATEASPGITHSSPGVVPTEDGEIGQVLPSVGIEIRPGNGFLLSGDSLCMAIISGGIVDFPKTLTISDELARRSDGVFIFRGRNDLMLNRGGQKFYLEEIERFVYSKFGIESVAMSIPDARLGFDLGLLLKRPPLGSDRPLLRMIEALHERYFVNFDAKKLRWTLGLPLNNRAKLDRNAAFIEFEQLASGNSVNQDLR